MVHSESKLDPILSALRQCGSGKMEAAALAFFAALGYKSARNLQAMVPSSPMDFQKYVTDRGANIRFDPLRAQIQEWKSIHFLFQFTQEELSGETRTKFEPGEIQSFVFAVIDLHAQEYSRSSLASIARTVNRSFPMPVVILFRHAEKVSLAYIHRRPGKKEPERDVLEKVSIIKDIRCENVHRGHRDLLNALASGVTGIRSFSALQDLWEGTLDTSLLNKRFYQELANWYFWARQHVKFPDDVVTNAEERNSIMTIRLITRIIFIWFLREKNLIPDELFDQNRMAQIVREFGPSKKKNANYYRAILQNLFFATLNTKMDPNVRMFAKASSGKTDGKQEYGVKNLYRYQDHFLISESEALSLFGKIPFLNGGLFDCLDRADPQKKGGKSETYLDGFSRNSAKQATVPDFLFFGSVEEADLSSDYGEKRKAQEKVQGLFHILEKYKFTIAENTPLEEEVALDPELLGKVFENLLASYNPETKATARKATGSFYTPREIVEYMVDEALIVALAEKIAIPLAKTTEESESLVRANLQREPAEVDLDVADALIEAVYAVKILDPACGSGAFPMGMLHRLTDLLRRLDPENNKWKELQLKGTDPADTSYAQELARIKADLETTRKIQDTEARNLAAGFLNDRRQKILDSFQPEAPDYARKLYLIENCIYGVDIQPIATQIAKLRFFISLIVDQRVDDRADNRGVLALPNLETKFVAANTLLGLDNDTQQTIRNPQIEILEKQLQSVRHRYFEARTRADKLACQSEDTQLRRRIAELLSKDGWDKRKAEKIASFDPYDQNIHADWFDPEWMFGVLKGFDILIANPPYVRHESIKKQKSELKEQGYECFESTADLFVYFYERSVKLLARGGAISFISPNKYYRAAYGEKLRKYLARELALRRLLDFGDAPIFEAIAYASILIGKKGVPDRASPVRAHTWPAGKLPASFEYAVATSAIELSQSELRPSGWHLEPVTSLRLLEKLRENGRPLIQFVSRRFYYGIKTGLNEAFVVDQSTRDRLIQKHKSAGKVLKPLLRGRDIQRWTARFQNLYLIKIPSSENTTHAWTGKPDTIAETIFAETYPSIHEYLKPFRTHLRARDDQGKYFWELRSCVYWQEFDEPKIVIPAIARQNDYAVDFDRHCTNDKTSICVTEHIHYILGVLNSSTLWWFIRKTAASRQGGYYEFKPMYVSVLPIPDVPAGNRRNVELCVEQILNIKKQNADSDVSQLEREIDKLVYALYGLSTEEIRIIEDE